MSISPTQAFITFKEDDETPTPNRDRSGSRVQISTEDPEIIEVVCENDFNSYNLLRLAGGESCSWLDSLTEVELGHPKCWSWNFAVISTTDRDDRYDIVRQRFGLSCSFEIRAHYSKSDVVAVVFTEAGSALGCMKSIVSQRLIQCPPGNAVANIKILNENKFGPYLYSAAIASSYGCEMTVFEQKLVQRGTRTFMEQSGEKLAEIDCSLVCQCLGRGNMIRIIFHPACHYIDKLIFLDYALTLLEQSCSSPRQWIIFACSFLIPCLTAALILYVASELLKLLW